MLVIGRIRSFIGGPHHLWASAVLKITLLREAQSLSLHLLLAFNYATGSSHRTALYRRSISIIMYVAVVEAATNVSFSYNSVKFYTSFHHEDLKWTRNSTNSFKKFIRYWLSRLYESFKKNVLQNHILF